ncbi:MAG: sulfite exporter TauE/SafE family protein [Alphaproteobacteria bacterium]|nr:sulfite exporter TauE/SafE family protein [Alphaproteobacteria bacterium]MCD8525963.1 sulfite exporter TauE/SafE family protein [Alphaproteobacteria bacterium]MCD8570901.1 sulfite exporter TauE/SafE family protein [Alphaproteobacteria bacterium]
MLIAQCLHDVSTSYGLPLSLFLAGLVGGFTHCAGMCAPFVLAQTSDNPQLNRLSSSLLLPYHLGRMTTYVALAILVSSLINLAFLFSDLKILISVPLLMLAGVMFLVTAFPRFGMIFPWTAGIRLSLPYRFISKALGRLGNNPNSMKRYGMGVLLGFMPCGLVLAALMASASAPSPIYAGAAMAAFTLGTIPALVAVAWAGGALRHKFPHAGGYLKRGALVLSSFWLFLTAGLMIF